MISFLKFDLTFSGKMENVKMRWEQNEVSSKYNPRTTHAGNAVSVNLYKALQCFYYPEDHGAFVGKISDKEYVAELRGADLNGKPETQLCRIKKGKDDVWTVYAGITTSEDPTHATINKKYMVAQKGVAGHNGTLVLLALMPEILRDQEAQEVYNDLIPFLSLDEEAPEWDNETNLEIFGRTVALFTDNVYRRSTTAGINPDAAILLPKEAKDIKMFRLSDLNVECEETWGEPIFFAGAELKPEDLPEYHLDGANNPVQLPANFKVAKWMKDIAFEMHFSSKYGEPVRTAMLVGPAGTGKSLGAMGIANMLGLQYRHYTCNPDTELFDLFGQLFPATGSTEKVSFEDVRTQMGLPSVEDVTMDLKSSFVKVFKKPYDGLTTEAEVINEVINLVHKQMEELVQSNSYTYVEGDLTKALRNGDLLEIQEVGIIQRPGVAVGLNAILETGCNAFVTLPTGEVLHKHKNCVIVLTSNDEYEGTGNVNQSVLSRMGLVQWFKNASVKEMVARTKSVVTDFIDDKLLTKTATLLQDITQFCSEQGITDGVCGQRELTNFAIGIMAEVTKKQLTSVDDETYLKVLRTHVLSKVSQNEEDVASVIDALINPKYEETVSVRI